ncbi:transporter substrate-binding domain-containing protein [Hyphomicrobiales bacterium BP6-180914]|uniref:Transporter substrate-binding domain-containing protein n=1 Tax=Lichenifustis flavocetrariae TaxID=2949735 RepID=A0AA42CMP6_9HYPH|nr:transporter substrate-binding domain-containing protein [Lichenifustis flavocetrariae]MCW6511806.1 transporter substrate-binding domain-containing protein [Lichenifustis flavocetrariae]
MGQAGIRRHDPGPYGAEVRHDFLVDVDHARACRRLFSKPYLSDQFRFYGPKGHDVTFPEGLDGKRVGVFAGSSGEQFIKSKWGDKVETRPYQNLDQVNADLEAGRIDYGFNGQLPVSTFLKSAAGTESQWYGPSYSDPILGRGAGALLRKDEMELATKVNEAIAAVYADGTFEKLSQSYFGPQIDIKADKLW